MWPWQVRPSRLQFPETGSQRSCTTNSGARECYKLRSFCYNVGANGDKSTVAHQSGGEMAIEPRAGTLFFVKHFARITV